jgi:two-component system, LuxR family, response regulator FixJ
LEHAQLYVFGYTMFEPDQSVYMSTVSSLSGAHRPIVVLIDDDELLASALASVLRAAHFNVRSYDQAQTYLDAYDPSEPGCVVSDIRMPVMDGLSLQQQLNKRGAINPLIFITSHADVTMAVHAMREGAFDFLEKPVDDRRLIGSVQRALEIDQTNRSKLAVVEDISRRFDALTRREREVLNLMAAGKPNKLIAAELNIAERTVEYHRASLMEKTDAPSLAHLLRMKLELERHR